MEKILSEFKVQFGKYLDVVQYDNRNDFKNKCVDKLLDDLKIKHFTTLIKHGGKAFFNCKAAIVERLNRTLKTMMWKYFTEEKTKKWLHILENVIFNYNHSINRTIHMKPSDMNNEIKDKVWATLFGDFDYTKKPRYKIGDLVRVEKYHSGTQFVKGYTINFTKETFKNVVYCRDPIMYSIQDIGTC